MHILPLIVDKDKVLWLEFLIFGSTLGTDRTLLILDRRLFRRGRIQVSRGEKVLRDLGPESKAEVNA